jgi:biotin-dependent carboxylase-like uncharacterized protein
MITVVRAGALTTVQDLGRPGWAHLGVPRSGALDGPALQHGNALVGNPDGAAGLETTVTGCTVRFEQAALVAVTGAQARVRVDGVAGEHGARVEVPAGGVLDIGPARGGLRSYLAVAGGIAVEPVLGSRSTDTLSGLGPPRVADGTTLPVGAAPPPGIALAAGTAPAVGTVAGGAAAPEALDALTVRTGPRDDWFVDRDALFTTVWTVTPLSNRVGVRLSGEALRRARPGELPSEGMVLGAIQVPPDGQPVIFLADHPTTGGYPVIGVVDDVTPLAQARPGTTVGFRGPQR